MRHLPVVPSLGKECRLMNAETWTAVDRYYAELLFAPDAALQDALKASAEAGLPEIQVQPHIGRMLEMLARMCGARRILELGTLGGYSTLWLASALPADGRLITLESDPAHARVARTTFA